MTEIAHSTSTITQMPRSKRTYKIFIISAKRVVNFPTVWEDGQHEQMDKVKVYSGLFSVSVFVCFYFSDQGKISFGDFEYSAEHPFLNKSVGFRS